MSVAAHVSPTKEWALSGAHFFLRACVGFALGTLAWRLDAGMALLALFPFVVLYKTPPVHALLAAFGYYVGISLDEIGALQRYYPSLSGVWAWPLWLTHMIVIAAPWGLAAWFARNLWTRFLVGSAISVFPPFGWISWCHPLFAAGFVFPGTGWLGILLALLVFPALAVWIKRRLVWGWAILAVFVLISTHEEQGPDPLRGWAFSTSDGVYELHRGYDRIRRFNEAWRALKDDAHASIGVLPEGYLGRKRESVEVALNWASRQLGKEKVLFVGALTQEESGIANALLAVGEVEGVVYRARVPVPASALGLGGERELMHPLRAPILDLRDERVFFALCWETALLEHLGLALFYKPDALVAASNLWMVERNGLTHAIQQRSLRAIARLLGIDVYWAINT